MKWSFQSCVVSIVSVVQYKIEVDMEKCCEDMAVYLLQCGKETQRTSTFADEEINIKIENRWAWR